jgi:hypothetical protein
MTKPVVLEVLWGLGIAKKVIDQYNEVSLPVA